jgi:hypothetical protein
MAGFGPDKSGRMILFDDMLGVLKETSDGEEANEQELEH